MHSDSPTFLHSRSILPVVWLICIALLTIGLNIAQALGDKYAGEFLKFGLGVREMSRGGAVVAQTSPTVAHYWNPAYLHFSERLAVQAMHTEEFAGVLQIDHLAVSLPRRGDFAFGAGFFRLGVDDIPDTRRALLDLGTDGLGPGDANYPGPDADGTEGNGKLDAGERLDFGRIGRFGASENALFLAAAHQYRPQIFLGATTKILYKSLANTRAFGLGFDLAALWMPVQNFSAGAILRDITTTLLFWNDGTQEIIVPSAQVGAQYLWHLPSLKLSLAPSAGLDLLMEGAQNYRDFQLGVISGRFRLGLEINYKNLLALRCGRDDLQNLQIGLGLNTRLGCLDYGLALGHTAADLGQSHRVALTIFLHEAGAALKRHL